MAPITFVDNKLEISANGTAWTEIGDFGNTVEVDGGERATDKIFVFSQDYPYVTKGKRDVVSVKAKLIYTEGATDPRQVAQDAYDNNTNLYLRWSPQGGAVGQKQYATPAGVIKKPLYPSGDASSAEGIMVEIELEVPYITETTVAV